jgi:SAM-dependent methyltransferase
MPLGEASYLQRDRAESFGSVAALYDRYRPGYPAPLIDALVALTPRAVLDIGSGTGKATALLAARGLDVLGVEIDPQMAEVARGHGIPVEVGSFETWDDAGRRFDLITCAQAWHWVDPGVGAPKAARLLNPGGTVVLFWNHMRDFDNEAGAPFKAVYAEHAPELLPPDERERGERDRPYVADLEASAAFGSIEVKEYEYERTFSADEWTGMVSTHSDHLQLEPARRQALCDALREMIDARGGSVVTSWGTYSIWARP